MLELETVNDEIWQRNQKEKKLQEAKIEPVRGYMQEKMYTYPENGSLKKKLIDITWKFSIYRKIIDSYPDILEKRGFLYGNFAYTLKWILCKPKCHKSDLKPTFSGWKYNFFCIYPGNTGVGKFGLEEPVQHNIQSAKIRKNLKK